MFGPMVLLTGPVPFEPVILGKELVAHAVGGILKDILAKKGVAFASAKSIIPEPVRSPI